MIQQDKISYALIALTFAITIYLATYQTTTIIIFPAILLLIGLVMETRFEKQKEVDYSSVTKQDVATTGYYTIIALVGMLAVGYAISITDAIQSIASLSTVFDVLVYSILIAVAEEQFFRAFITDLLLSNSYVKNNRWLRIGYPYNALVISALIFAGYHLARYGTSLNSLIYVFAGGFLLSWVAFKVRRLGPSMFAHVANNVVSVLGGL